MKLIKKGEIIASEGDIDTNVFILLKGMIGVFKGGVELARFCEKGTVIGEMSMILETPRTATIKALEDSYIAEIIGNLEKIIEKFPDITKNIVVNLAERLMKTTEDFGIIAEKLNDVEGDEYCESLKIKEDMMKTYTEYMWFRSAEEQEFIDITKNVEALVTQSDVKEGVAHIFSMDSFSGIVITNFGPAVLADIDKWLDKNISQSDSYVYKTDDMITSGSHIRNVVMKNNASIPITKGKIDISSDQAIYFADFDGKKRKKIIVKIIGL